MPSDSSLINFRVSAEDHDLLRAVAQYRNESLSSFVRRSALTNARRLLEEVGSEAIIEGNRQHANRQQTAAARQLEERLENVRKQIAEDRADSDARGRR